MTTALSAPMICTACLPLIMKTTDDAIKCTGIYTSSYGMLDIMRNKHTSPNVDLTWAAKAAPGHRVGLLAALYSTYA